MGLAPPDRLEPFTVRVVKPVDPDALSVAVPRAVAPEVKVTLPDGAMVPDAGFTVAVRTVDEVAAILAGAAVAVVVVVGRAAVTVRFVMEEFEPRKLPEPA